MALSATCVAALGACSKPAPKGQVLASVNGQDVTLQDVRAEGRASGTGATSNPQLDAALLQRVIDRKLLAQSAHAQKMDQTPQSPSDLARLQETWLAEKAAAVTTGGLKPPTEAEVSSFMAAHPYAFAKRQRITARTIDIASAPSLLKTLSTYKTLDQIEAFLTRLGVGMRKGSGAIDTAQLPEAASEKLVQSKAGDLIILQPPGRIQIAEIQGHVPVSVPIEEQKALATRTLAQQAIAGRVGGEVKRLRDKAKISYQPGYGPKPPAAAGAAAKPAAAK